MPRGDRTGPMGRGPMTGRTAGYCGGYGMPGYANQGPGRFFGKGMAQSFWDSWGRGWRPRHWAAGPGGWGTPFGWAGMASFGLPTPEAEKQLLEGQATALQNQLDEIKKRLDEFAKQASKEA